MDVRCHEVAHCPHVRSVTRYPLFISPKSERSWGLITCRVRLHFVPNFYLRNSTRGALKTGTHTAAIKSTLTTACKRWDLQGEKVHCVPLHCMSSLLEMPKWKTLKLALNCHNHTAAQWCTQAQFSCQRDTFTTNSSTSHLTQEITLTCGAVHSGIFWHWPKWFNLTPRLQLPMLNFDWNLNFEVVIMKAPLCKGWCYGNFPFILSIYSSTRSLFVDIFKKLRGLRCVPPSFYAS